MSREVINQFEGIQIDTMIWPFYSYNVLLPKQIKIDLLVWLFLSILVYFNRTNKKPLDSYDDNEIDSVVKIMKDKFSSILDKQTIENILSNVYKNFTIDIKNQNNVKKRCLIDETFSFLETFEDLFSSQTKVYKIYQDAVTGAVVPYFDDMGYIKDAYNSNAYEIQKIIKKKPSRASIQKAYDLFIKMSKANADLQSLSNDPDFYDDPLADPDEEIAFDDSNEFADAQFKKVKKIIDFNDFNVIYIDNSRIDYKIEVSLIIKNNQVEIVSDFPQSVSFWLNNRFKFAIKKDKQLMEKMKDYQETYLNNKIDESALINFQNRDTQNQLNTFQDLFRVAKSIDNKELEKITMRLDYYATTKFDGYFTEIGKFLECLIEPVKDMDRNKKNSYDLNLFIAEIENIGQQLNINTSKLSTNDVFSNWKKSWGHFKADIANILLQNVKIKKNNLIYQEIVTDMFELYDIRNKASHYRKNQKLNFDDVVEHANKLYNISRAIVELY